MRLDQITEIAADHLFGRLIRRALMALAVAALGIVAIYYFTVAGTVALETQYGTLNARLIVGIIYTAVAIIIAIWWAMQGKSANFSTPVLSNQRDTDRPARRSRDARLRTGAKRSPSKLEFRLF